jgi:hypothetical protein
MTRSRHLGRLRKASLADTERHDADVSKADTQEARLVR